MMDAKAVELKLSDVTVTPIPMTKSQNQYHHHQHQQQHPQHPQIQITPALPPQFSSPSQHLSTTSISAISLQQQPQQQQHHQQPPTSPIIITTQTSANITTPMTSASNIPSNLSNLQGLSKYAQLLAVIEEMGRDIRPTYTGSRSSTERLKRGIVHARILVRECLMETERSARQ